MALLPEVSVENQGKVSQEQKRLDKNKPQNLE